MRHVLLFLLAAVLSQPLMAHGPGDFVVLSYHEVTGDHPETFSSTAVSARELAAQFAWLRASGYHPVSIDAILASRRGGAPLPDQALLITFDDGLASIYTRAFPLLTLFHYPAVVAPVGSWMDLQPGVTVDYDAGKVSRRDFVTWEQLKDMQQSGLIEIATHSYALHVGIVGNPQGNLEPAAITHHYVDGHYETDDAYEARLRADLAKARDQIVARTGRAPRVIVWPYGRSNGTAQDIASSLGMPLGLTLEDGVNGVQTPLATIRRYLIQGPTTLANLAEILRQTWPPPPRRALRIDPGDWPAIPGEERLSATLEALLAIKANLVFLGPREMGEAGQRALFPTGQLPVKSDLLNRVAWQITSRTGAAVYIDLPEDWLGNTALVADMARQVHFTGLSVPAAPGSAVAERLRHAAERWRWPMHLVYALTSLPDDHVWNQLPEGDWIRLPANDAILAGLPDAAKGHVILEFDPAGLTSSVAGKMRMLEARGFGDLAIAGLPSPMPDDVTQAFSLRDEPQ